VKEVLDIQNYVFTCYHFWVWELTYFWIRLSIQIHCKACAMAKGMQKTCQLLMPSTTHIILTDLVHTSTRQMPKRASSINLATSSSRPQKKSFRKRSICSRKVLNPRERGIKEIAQVQLIAITQEIATPMDRRKEGHPRIQMKKESSRTPHWPIYSEKSSSRASR